MAVGMPYEGAHAVSQRFGSNTAAYARFGMRGHNGIDFALPAKTGLLAVAAGTITERRSDPTGYGLYAVLTDAEGGQWLYGHASRWYVSLGATVKPGQRLGLSGNSGNSTGPHLHLGYRPYGYDRQNGYLGYTNPRPLLPLPYRVALQTGHVPDGGGAPGEAEWTPKLRAALTARLEAAGVGVAPVPGFYDRPAPPVLAQDFDLFLSIHYDAAIYGHTTGNSGCIVARGDYETEWWEADRFLEEWLHGYPPATGIPPRQERVNPNMTQYYALRHLSYVTPGLVLEHGVGAPGVGLDADTLWNHLETVADADAAAVLRYLRPTPADEELAMDTTPEEREAMRPYFEMLEVPVNMESAIMKRACLAYKRGETRGPALSDEYPYMLGERMVTRQDFTAGVGEWDPATGETAWVEVVKEERELA